MNREGEYVALRRCLCRELAFHTLTCWFWSYVGYALVAPSRKDSRGSRRAFLCLLLLVTVKQVTNCEKERFYREHQRKDASPYILTRKQFSRLCRINLKNGGRKGLREYLVPGWCCRSSRT